MERLCPVSPGLGIGGVGAGMLQENARGAFPESNPTLFQNNRFLVIYLQCHIFLFKDPSFKGLLILSRFGTSNTEHLVFYLHSKQG